MSDKTKALNSRTQQIGPNRALRHTCALEIRPLTLADLAAVMALEQVSFPSPWSLATFHRELTRKRRSRYLKVSPLPKSNPPALPALIAQGGFMRFGPELHVVTIAVQPDWRDRSIGEWLLLALLALGRDEGARTAALEVRVSNQAALRLYRKLNFAEAGYRRRYYPDKEDARILELADLRSPRVWSQLRERYKRLSALMTLGVDIPRQDDLEERGRKSFSGGSPNDAHASE